MITRVVFLAGAPFGRRDYDRFGVEVLRRGGLSVFVWELTRFLYPDVNRTVVTDRIDWDGIVCFDTTKDAVKAVSALGPGTFVMALIGLDGATLPIFRALSANGIPYCVGPLNNIPLGRIALRAATRAKFKRVTKRRVMTQLVRRLPLRMLGVAPAAFVLREGLGCSIDRKEVTAHTRVIPTHSSDYDIYLQLGKERGSSGTAVFMDNYLPLHPDFVYSQEQPPVTAGAFYPALERFLSRVEAALQLKIVVAAHPRCDVEVLRQHLPRWPIAKDMTAALVRDSNLVIVNHSTAISFAVLYEKPLMFVTSAEARRHSFHAHVAALAGSLAKPLIDIDDPHPDFGDPFNADAAKYREYRDRYIKMPDSPDRPAWQIFNEHIAALQ